MTLHLRAYRHSTIDILSSVMPRDSQHHYSHRLATGTDFVELYSVLPSFHLTGTCQKDTPKHGEVPRRVCITWRPVARHRKRPFCDRYHHQNTLIQWGRFTTVNTGSVRSRANTHMQTMKSHDFDASMLRANPWTALIDRPIAGDVVCTTRGQSREAASILWRLVINITHIRLYWRYVNPRMTGGL